MNNGKRRLVYLMGPAHSGSTVLTFLLADHPRIATIGELKATSMGAIEDYRCSCGEYITQCAFWRDIRERATTLPGGFSLDDFGTHFAGQGGLADKIFYSSLRGRLYETLRDLAIASHPRYRDHFKRVMRRNHDLVEIITGIMERDVFLDGSKDPVRLRYLCRHTDWDIHVILLIRDGRGTTGSYMRREGMTMEQAAREWKRTCLEYEHVQRYVDASRMRLFHYETICREPQAQLEAIHRFIGIEPVPYRGLNISDHHLLGNSMRLRNSARLRQDERWRSELSEEDLETFERIAGDLNRRFGYDGSSGQAGV